MNQLNVIKLTLYMIGTVFFFSLCFIVKYLALNNITREFTNPFFELDYMTNTGAAFSTLNHSCYVIAGVALTVLFFIVAYVCYNTHKTSYYKIILLSIFSAGIGANLFERLKYGYVEDYISIKLFSFPIFNFQDILIVTSCILLIFAYQFKIKNNQQTDAVTMEPCDDSTVEEHNQY